MSHDGLLTSFWPGLNNGGVFTFDVAYKTSIGLTKERWRLKAVNGCEMHNVKWLNVFKCCSHVSSSIKLQVQVIRKHPFIRTPKKTDY